MEYLINPMWFYWVHVIDTARTMIAVIFCIAILSAIILVGAVMGEWCYDDKGTKLCKIWLAISIVVSVIFAFAFIFIPSKNTMVEMQIARYATKQNLEIGIDAIKSATDYVINAIQSIK